METESLLKMDIFFVVATTAVLVTGLLAAIVLWYVVRIVRDIREITRLVKDEAKDIAKDFSEVRKDVREGVAEVRESVGDGIETAKAYSRAVTGTGIVKAVSHLLDAFAEEKDATEKRKSTRKRKSS